MIYEPEEDSYLLETYVKKLAKGKVLDMGTGSGIQAEAALAKANDVLAVDIGEEAVAFVKMKGIKTIQSNLFQKIKGKFDTIIFNPPYLPEDSQEDEESKRITTGGKEGSELLEKFLKQAKDHLDKKGQILLVCSSLTGNVESLFRKHGYQWEKLEEKSFFFEKLNVYRLTLS